MARAESLVCLQRAVLLATRALSSQFAGVRPAATAVHQALQAAATALSADVDRSSSLSARHARWGPAPLQHHTRGWQTGARQYSVAHATAAAPTEAGLVVTGKAIQRLQELASDSPAGEATVLRLTVEGGGCSGYTYNFTLEGEARPEDRVVEEGGVQLVCDPVSYEFVRGATVDYTTDIIRSAFEVVTNPNAQASCGCGSSFAPKD